MVYVAQACLLRQEVLTYLLPPFFVLLNLLFSPMKNYWRPQCLSLQDLHLLAEAQRQKCWIITMRPTVSLFELLGPVLRHISLLF